MIAAYVSDPADRALCNALPDCQAGFESLFAPGRGTEDGKVKVTRGRTGNGKREQEWRGRRKWEPLHVWSLVTKSKTHPWRWA